MKDLLLATPGGFDMVPIPGLQRSTWRVDNVAKDEQSNPLPVELSGAIMFWQPDDIPE